MRDTPQSPARQQLWLNVGVSLALCLAGLVFAGFGLFRYGVWLNNGPGPGFFPFLAGLLTAIPAAVTVFGKVGADAERPQLRSMLPAIGIIAAVLLVPVLGMVEALSIFILLWIRFVEKRSWRDALIASISGFVVTHLIFSVWLSVLFPESLIPSILTLWS